MRHRPGIHLCLRLGREPPPGLGGTGRRGNRMDSPTGNVGRLENRPLRASRAPNHQLQNARLVALEGNVVRMVAVPTVSARESAPGFTVPCCRTGKTTPRRLQSPTGATRPSRNPDCGKTCAVPACTSGPGKRPPPNPSPATQVRSSIRPGRYQGAEAREWSARRRGGSPSPACRNRCAPPPEPYPLSATPFI